ncbi:Not1 and DUF3819 domain containing protein [Trichuris trichiura]|uniref:Not1 and DUF3819 domain containing protein n=1 Tax=Trichuris trichiura TaxID=36087 RepID=A0A077YXE3_TRITR|nr:Not1 and DUF3819 domain containing protein [Trichuris trichiura]
MVAVPIETEEEESSVLQKIKNVGCVFTRNVTACLRLAREIGLEDLTSSEVAEIVTMMVLGSDSSEAPQSSADQVTDMPNRENWHPIVFAKALRQISPDLDWYEVIFCFDTPSFVIKNRACLSSLMSVLSVGFQNEPIPLKLLFNRWENPEAQLSWISQILQNPDVVSFSDYPFTPVNVEGVQLLPSDCTSKEMLTWQSLELITILVDIGENSSLSNAVQDCFNYPVKNCPVLLLAGLFMIGPPVSGFRQELLHTVLLAVYDSPDLPLPIFVKAWKDQTECQSTYRNILVHSIVSWYEKNPSESAKLCHFIEMIMHFRALQAFLNVPHYTFVIHLVCLTFNATDMPVDKWIHDKINDCGENFAQACINFMKEHCFVQTDDLAVITLDPSIPPEMVSSLLAGLQSSSAVLSIKINNAVESIATKWRAYLTASVVVESVGPFLKAQANQPKALDPFMPTASCEKNISLGVPSFTDLQSSAINSASNPLMPGTALRTSTIVPHAVPPREQPFNPSETPYDYSCGDGTIQSSVDHGSLGSSTQYPSLCQLPYEAANAYTTGGSSAARSFYGENVQSQNDSLLMAAPPPNASTSTSVGSVGQPPSYPSSSSAANITSATPVQLSIEDAITIDSLPPFAVDVQKEASAMFHKLFMQPPQMGSTVEQFLDLMKRLKESSVKRENNLIEEFRFLNEYPDRELRCTAAVFGSCIRERLFRDEFIGIALRLVMDVLRREVDSKLFNFGVAALEQFKSNLKMHPRFCEAIISHIPGFNSFSELLKEYVQAGARSEDPITRALSIKHGTSSGAPFHLPSGAMKPPRSGASVAPMNISQPTSSDAPAKPKSSAKPSVTTTNTETRVSVTDEAALQHQPEEAVQLQISFLFNNLSQANLNEKVEQMRDVIFHPSNTPWLAQYLVVKRISLELNFHNLYFNFLTALNFKNLNKLIIDETYKSIKILLSMDKSKANLSDRTLLKNLGHWLGKMTIGKNTPIDSKSLDLKLLLVEAFVRGNQELLFVIPFAVKVMEACHQSHVFSTRSPWTTCILRLLCELHEEPDVRLNLKFEVEVLCRLLNVDIIDFATENSLYDHDAMLACLRNHQLGNEPLEHKVAVKMCTVGPHAIPLPLHAMEAPMNALSGMMTVLMPIPMLPDRSVMTDGDSTEGEGAMVSCSYAFDATLSPHSPFTDSDGPIDLDSLFSKLEIHSSITLFQINPSLKQEVFSAVEQAMVDVITTKKDRVLNISLSTCHLLLRKDYAVESNEQVMMKAARNMGRVTGATMAHSHCRDPLRFALLHNLKERLYSSYESPSSEQQNMIEEAALILTDENIELCLCYLMRHFAGKLNEELDNTLRADYESRRIARSEGRPFLDTGVQITEYHVPPSMEMPSNLQSADVHSFNTAADVPGFKVPTAEELPNVQLPKPTIASVEEHSNNLLHSITRKVDEHIKKYAQDSLSSLPGYDMLLAMRDAVGMSEQASAHDFYGAISNMIGDIFLMITADFVAIVGNIWAQKQVAGMLVCGRSDMRLNWYAIDFLIRNMLADSDAIAVTKHLLRLYLVERKLPANLFTESDWMQAMGMLQAFGLSDENNFPTSDSPFTEMRYLQAPPPPFLPPVSGPLVQQGSSQGFQHTGAPLISSLTGGPTFQQCFASAPMVMPPGAQSVECVPTTNEPSIGRSFHLELVARPERTNILPAFAYQVQAMLREWVTIFYSPEYFSQPDQVFLSFSSKMWALISITNYLDPFIRICTQMSIDLCHCVMSDQLADVVATRIRCSVVMGPYVALLIQMVKYTSKQMNTTKTAFLNQIMISIGNEIASQQELRRLEMRTLPIEQMLMLLFFGLTAGDPMLADEGSRIVVTYCNGLHLIRPQRVPIFTCCWMDIVGHRRLIGAVLAGISEQKGFHVYAKLLLDIVKFLAPFLRSLQFTKSISIVYRGFLRILLVLLHDFPELLCDYYFAFCDFIPTNCVQLRNLIISAYPRTIRLPDPFLPISELEKLNDMNVEPRLIVDFKDAIQPVAFRDGLDEYLANRAPVSFLSGLRSRLQISSEPGRKYNVPLLNSVVIYVGIRAVKSIQAKNLRPNISAISHSAHMDIFQNLAVDLDSEGRYLFFNSIVNQLRYPNSHTLYFGCTLLYLFSEANSEVIQEQITRVLIERLISVRPHPWGLMMTFAEMVNNNSYKFWDHYFVTCSSEIEWYRLICPLFNAILQFIEQACSFVRATKPAAGKSGKKVKMLLSGVMKF